MDLHDGRTIQKDVLIIGGGPAGMAAMDALYELGITDIILAERSEKLGGLLEQCIHDGFGLIKFGNDYSGPEYAEIYARKLKKLYDNILLNATVTSIRPAAENLDVCSDNTDHKNAEEINYSIRAEIATVNGTVTVETKTIVLATGCRERGRGAAYIPGTRPAGVYSAGTAQALVNLHNLMIGKSAVIVGSGDIGLIMARRLSLEGVKVKCIVEIDKVPGGLPRNLRQCVYDFDIPLYLDTSVTDIHGDQRVTGVTLSNGEYIECDTVILSVGLIPENSLIDHKSGVSCESKGLLNDKTTETVNNDISNSIFLCGNALYVHGLVDDVSDSGEHVAKDIKDYLSGEKILSFSKYQLSNIEKTRETERQRLMEHRQEMTKKALSGEYDDIITCILCPNSCEIRSDGSGGKCPKGAAYANEERTAPKRVLTTSVMVWSDLISVRTSKAIPKEHIEEAMQRIRNLRFGPDCASSFRGEPLPPRPMIRPGDVLVKSFIDGADLIATRGNVKI